jgi:hypothetical protein
MLDIFHQHSHLGPNGGDFPPYTVNGQFSFLNLIYRLIAVEDFARPYVSERILRQKAGAIVENFPPFYRLWWRFPPV